MSHGQWLILNGWSATWKKHDLEKRYVERNMRIFLFQINAHQITLWQQILINICTKLPILWLFIYTHYCSIGSWWQWLWKRKWNLCMGSVTWIFTHKSQFGNSHDWVANLPRANFNSPPLKLHSCLGEPVTHPPAAGRLYWITAITEGPALCSHWKTLLCCL